MAKQTGSRPRPAVPKSRSKSATKPPGNRRATRNTPMPAPKTAATTRGLPRSHGG